jgi:hypothetical protein
MEKDIVLAKLEEAKDLERRARVIRKEIKVAHEKLRKERLTAFASDLVKLFREHGFDIVEDGAFDSVSYRFTDNTQSVAGLLMFLETICDVNRHEILGGE